MEGEETVVVKYPDVSRRLVVVSRATKKILAEFTFTIGQDENYAGLLDVLALVTFPLGVDVEIREE